MKYACTGQGSRSLSPKTLRSLPSAVSVPAYRAKDHEAWHADGVKGHRAPPGRTHVEGIDPDEYALAGCECREEEDDRGHSQIPVHPQGNEAR